MISRWLNLSLYPLNLRQISITYFKIIVCRNFAYNLFIITLVLFLLDNLSAISVGLIWGLYFGISAIIDYPTGILGDLIGYKTLLLIAYIMKIVSTLFLIFGNDFWHYAIFMIIFAVGDSQESGALESWYDNQYRDIMAGIDETRDLYMSFIAKTRGTLYFAAVIGYALGGIITTLTFSKLLFIFYSLLNVLILIFILEMEKAKLPEKVSFKEYLHTLLESIRVFVSNRTLFFYLLGTAFLIAANQSIWYTFQLYKIYRDYTGSDAGAGILRSLVFLSGLLWSIAIIPLIKKFKHEKVWVFLSSVISNSFFFVLVIFYYIFFPPKNFNIILIGGFLLIYQLPASWEALEGILRQRINLDLIPNTVRNSLYSLLPTISWILGSFFVIVTGFVMERYGFIISMWWLVLVCIIGSINLGIGLLRKQTKSI